MTKVAILGDTHFGARNDHQAILKHQKKFFQEVFFPTLKRRKITHIIQLGDLVDRRKYVNYVTLKDGLVESFLKPIQKNEMQLLWFPGNHDAPFKDNLNYSSLDILLSVSGSTPDHIIPVTYPQDIEFAGKQIAVFPWICDDNREDSFNLMQESTSELAVGHFELMGYAMNPGFIAPEGDDPQSLAKFKKVLSGHYHTSTEGRNVTYVRIPYEISWSDYGDSKGFHILDTDTLELETIDNPHTLHEKVYYNEEDPNFKKWVKGSFNTCKDKFVKLVVEKRGTKSTYINNVIEAIEAAGCIELQIIDVPEMEVSALEGISATNFDISELITNKIKHLDTALDKGQLNHLMLELYNKAANITNED